MKSTLIRWTSVSVLVAAAFVTLVFLIVRPALAQVDATSSEDGSSDAITPDVTSPDSFTSSITNDISTASDTATDDSTSAASEVSPGSTIATPTGDLVEVRLRCSMSYVGPLYDTPSGHLEDTGSVDADGASTTTAVL